MNYSSEFDDFMNDMNEILDDLDSIYNSIPQKQKEEIYKPNKNKKPYVSYHASGIPRHPNIPSFYEKKKPSTNILGIAFIKKSNVKGEIYQ